MNASATERAQAALENLAAALGPRFVTTLVTGTGCRPRLSVISRDSRAGEDIYADDHGWFWSAWAERIATTDDPLTAAYHVTTALRGTRPAGGQR